MTLTEMRDKIGAFLLRGKHWDGAMAMWTDLTDDGVDREGVKLHLFTERHHYAIVMEPASGGEKSYLGCVMSNRAPWPGEKHTRGGDLADGEFNDETLLRIMADILSKELVSTMPKRDAAPEAVAAGAEA